MQMIKHTLVGLLGWSGWWSGRAVDRLEYLGVEINVLHLAALLLVLFVVFTSSSE